MKSKVIEESAINEVEEVEEEEVEYLEEEGEEDVDEYASDGSFESEEKDIEEEEEEEGEGNEGTVTDNGFGIYFLAIHIDISNLIHSLTINRYMTQKKFLNEYGPPTNEEIQSMKETEQLFKSNIFRLQVHILFDFYFFFISTKEII